MKIFGKDWFKKLLNRGININYSDGPAFDPTDQERTDPLEDIAKNKEVTIGNLKREVK